MSRLFDPAKYIDPSKFPPPDFSYYEASKDYAKWRDEILRGRRKPLGKDEITESAELAAKHAVESRRTSNRITSDLVKEWVGRITYKPDTRFTVLPDFYGSLYADYGAIYGNHTRIRVERQLPDSTRPDMTLRDYTDRQVFIPVGCTFTVPTIRLEALPMEEQFSAFAEWMHRKVIWLERHEIDEWFRVDDKLPFDPHAMPGMAAETRQSERDDMDVSPIERARYR